MLSLQGTSLAVAFDQRPGLVAASDAHKSSSVTAKGD